ncbi:helix-turn-helix transcriptional regulator [Roseibium sp. CAU 1637]|uniref:Helix-turn-helix transcriptional regulator n=1 Tax=Roseibium limicola TaxID=2816037 RepID=A0A939ER38_9HYPH|nr:helix-turn-helix transcriptional regulator [Roseibium limicola]MBO0346008.1 helix-turn-helix transcriptional regulator [Roseibium limicola]
MRDVRRALGNPDRAELARRLDISANSVSRYERGEQEPSFPVFSAYGSALGVNLHWLLTGTGSMFVGGDVKIENTTLADIRKILWNITATFWETVPRKTKPESVADQAVEMLDYLVSREGVNDEAVTEVIQFEAERLKRASDTSD